MPRDCQQLRRDALAIWHAGLDAVRSERLVGEALRLDGRTLWVGDESIDLDRIGRLAVVGAGKAGAGMAAAVEQILGPRLMAEKQLVGWVNVPADCTAAATSRIVLHAGRAAGVNEPTADGVRGAERILEIASALEPDDVCLCLISGGGSALLPCPVEGITLEDKLAVTRLLSSAGANIEQLNTVRKQLSRIKGGGLARSCRAGRLFALIISDVLGDPLDVIASGPTVANTTTAADALAVLEQFSGARSALAPRVFDYLRSRVSMKTGTGTATHNGSDREMVQDVAEPVPVFISPPWTSRVTNLVIGNNARAVDAAGLQAERLGYEQAMICAPRSEGPAEDVGRHLAAMARQMRGKAGPNCLISGGEPVVSLVEASRRGLGGRNQQLVLAALEELWADGANGIALLSGGTDGEDGPTDAAGALLDQEIIAAAKQRGLTPADFLHRNDAYRFFEPLDALLKTGPTHTNVCDVRVVLVDRRPTIG